jgi:hypothetical protein
VPLTQISPLGFGIARRQDFCPPHHCTLASPINFQFDDDDDHPDDGEKFKQTIFRD